MAGPAVIALLLDLHLEAVHQRSAVADDERDRPGSDLLSLERDRELPESELQTAPAGVDAPRRVRCRLLRAGGGGAGARGSVLGGRLGLSPASEHAAVARASSIAAIGRLVCMDQACEEAAKGPGKKRLRVR